jgi:outer membrane immunogenic protein
MTKHLSMAAGAILALGFTGPLYAADMPVKALKAPVVSVFTWTGCYIGGHGGGIWVRKEWSLPTNGFSLGSHDANGWLGGGQIGCNYQTGRWVFGLQGDYAWTHASGSNINPVGLTDTSTVRSLGSVTGRVGYAFDRFLGYVKGGVAWERDNYTFRGTTTGQLPAVAAVLPGTVAYSASETRSGWTIGVGGEYAFLDNWTAFLEYNYYDFGDRNVKFYNDANGLFVGEIAIRERKSVVKFGINYKFGGGAVVAKY